MENITENLRKTNITVSLHEKNNIYQAVINYKDDNNKRKQKWVSTGIKVARGNKRLALQKAEEYREQLREDGIEIAKYDYDRLYREKDAPYKEKYDKLVEFINNTKSKAKIVEELKEILGVKEDDGTTKMSGNG